MERIGVQYNKPFNIFNSILEEPVDPKMIYCKDVDKAQLILRQYKKQAMDAIEKAFQLEHEKIIRLGEQL